MGNNDVEKIKTEKIHQIITRLRINVLGEIYKKCIENNIDVLVYKGVALSIQLYNDEYRRFSGDIDCIVKKEQLKRFLSILKDLGFKFTENDKEIDVESWKTYIDFPHIRSLSKKAYIIPINLEVHLSTLSTNVSVISRIDLFKDTVELELKDGFKIYTLSYTNNFISLMNHYVHHLLTQILDYLWDIRKNIDFSRVYHLIEEVQLFYNNYNSLIDIDMVVDIGAKSDTVEMLLLAARHLTEYFNLRIFPIDRLEKLRNPNTYLHKEICKYLSSIPANTVSGMPADKLIDGFIKYSKVPPGTMDEFTIFQKKLWAREINTIVQDGGMEGTL